uniref:Uncharacterized protein n=1 Tax=Salmonella phage PMBT18 TaxID=3229742 RepID=A0AB39C1G0_9CAUD
MSYISQLFQHGTIILRQAVLMPINIIKCPIEYNRALYY